MRLHIFVKKKSYYFLLVMVSPISLDEHRAHEECSVHSIAHAHPPPVYCLQSSCTQRHHFRQELYNTSVWQKCFTIILFCLPRGGRSKTIWCFHCSKSILLRWWSHTTICVPLQKEEKCLLNLEPGFIYGELECLKYEPVWKKQQEAVNWSSLTNLPGFLFLF